MLSARCLVLLVCTGPPEGAATTISERIPVKTMKTYIFPILAVLLAVGVAAQEHQHGGSAAQPQNGQQHQGSTPDLQALDTRLDEKVAAMNAASGEARVDAMAALIDELMSQRKQMREMIAPMQPNTNSHAGAHMGPMPGRMSMGGCGTPRRMMH